MKTKASCFWPHTMTFMKRSVGVAFFLCGFLVVVAQTDSGPSSEIDRQMQTAVGLFEKGRTAKSKKIYQTLLLELRNRPPSSQLGFVLNGLSKIAAAEGEYKSALQLATQSGDIYHQVGDAGGESHSLNNQGIAEIRMGQYLPAQRTLETALLLSQCAQDTENQVQILNNLGSSYYFPGSYSEAMHRYDAALTLVEQNSRAKWSDYWRQITNFNQATLLQRLGWANRVHRHFNRWPDIERLFVSLQRANGRLGGCFGLARAESGHREGRHVFERNRHSEWASPSGRSGCDLGQWHRGHGTSTEDANHTCRRGVSHVHREDEACFCKFNSHHLGFICQRAEKGSGDCDPVGQHTRKPPQLVS